MTNWLKGAGIIAGGVVLASVVASGGVVEPEVVVAPVLESEVAENTQVPVLVEQPRDITIRPFMPLTGTRWVYEGKRTFYDPVSKSVKEVMARKVVEITSVASEGDSVRANFKETYTNDPDFTERTGSFLFAEDAFSFDGKTVTKFPLVEGQELTELGGEETDSLYVTSVIKVHKQTVLGTEYPCYDISNSTSGDVSFVTFCEGIGYIRDYYEHNGTPNKSDYQLISVPHPNEVL